MNDRLESAPSGRPRLGRDEAGSPNMPHLRTTLAGDVPPDVLATVEAFAALRWAAKLTHHVMERWAEKQGLSEGRLEVLAASGIVAPAFRLGSWPR
jgi:hypothetical protein